MYSTLTSAVVSVGFMRSMKVSKLSPVSPSAMHQVSGLPFARPVIQCEVAGAPIEQCPPILPLKSKYIDRSTSIPEPVADSTTVETSVEERPAISSTKTAVSYTHLRAHETRHDLV